MQTRKQYAHSLGLATLGRGRMSREAHAAIATAEAGGMMFMDTPLKGIATVKVTKTVKPADVTVDYGSSSGSDVTVVSEFRYPEKDFRWETVVNGKTVKVGARSVCYTCGYSLTNHTCSTPRALVGKTMTVEDVTPVRM